MITIIVPVYNVEQYLERQLESLCAQSYRDLEIILVNDGSTDRSGQICDEWAQRDQRIQVIHQANAGAPAARNRALAQAKGEYVAFIDADDTCESEMFEALHEAAEKFEADFVICGFKILTYGRTGKYEQVQALPDLVFPNEVSFRAETPAMFDVNLLYTPWNKLFRRSYLLEHGIEFPGTFWDDFPFNLAAIRNAKRVVRLNAPYYNFYRQRGESETAKYRPDMYAKRLEEHDWLMELYRDWEMLGQTEVREFLARRHLERLLGCVENVCEAGKTLTHAQKISQIKAILQDPNLPALQPYYHPGAFYTKIAMAPILARNTQAAWLVGNAIRIVKQRLTPLFALLKHRR